MPLICSTGDLVHELHQSSFCPVLCAESVLEIWQYLLSSDMVLELICHQAFQDPGYGRQQRNWSIKFYLSFTSFLFPNRDYLCPLPLLWPLLFFNYPVCQKCNFFRNAFPYFLENRHRDIVHSA